MYMRVRSFRGLLRLVPNAGWSPAWDGFSRWKRMFRHVYCRQPRRHRVPHNTMLHLRRCALPRWLQALKNGCWTCVGGTSCLAPVRKHGLVWEHALALALMLLPLWVLLLVVRVRVLELVLMLVLMLEPTLSAMKLHVHPQAMTLHRRLVWATTLAVISTRNQPSKGAQ